VIHDRIPPTHRKTMTHVTGAQTQLAGREGADAAGQRAASNAFGLRTLPHEVIQGRASLTSNPIKQPS
jgi:hypothetical protein